MAITNQQTAVPSAFLVTPERIMVMIMDLRTSCSVTIHISFFLCSVMSELSNIKGPSVDGDS